MWPGNANCPPIPPCAPLKASVPGTFWGGGLRARGLLLEKVRGDIRLGPDTPLVSGRGTEFR